MNKVDIKKLLKDCKIAREKADLTLREVELSITEGYQDALDEVNSYRL